MLNVDLGPLLSEIVRYLFERCRANRISLISRYFCWWKSNKNNWKVILGGVLTRLLRLVIYSMKWTSLFIILVGKFLKGCQNHMALKIMVFYEELSRLYESDKWRGSKQIWEIVYSTLWRYFCKNNLTIVAELDLPVQLCFTWIRPIFGFASEI